MVEMGIGRRTHGFKEGRVKKIVIAVVVVAAIALLFVVKKHRAAKVAVQTVEISTGTVKAAK